MMISQEKLKEIMHYDPLTGLFTSKIRVRSRQMDIGKKVGSPHVNGYLACMVDGKGYLMHRLAWLYMHGELPKEIDHINHIKTDNRIANLRAANSTLNSRNKPKAKNNKSGITGVCFASRDQKWQANIGLKGRRIVLGYFDNLFDACCARKSAELKYDYHDNHGKLLHEGQRP